MSSYDGDNAMLAATFHPYLDPQDAPEGYNSPVGQLSPVGSAILTCREVPMRKLCAKLPWENVHRSQCSVLSRGVEFCRWWVIGGGEGMRRGDGGEWGGWGEVEEGMGAIVMEEEEEEEEKITKKR